MNLKREGIGISRIGKQQGVTKTKRNKERRTKPKRKRLNEEDIGNSRIGKQEGETKRNK